MTATPVLAATAWRTNGELIAACAELGYLHTEDLVLDPTYGAGTWWKVWRPEHLTACDLDPTKSPIGYSVDFTSMPFDDGMFTAVTFDPPYKLNGTPTHDVDDRYGVAGAYTSRADRHRLMLAGLDECARVTSRVLLAKCQDQVNGGRVWWQTDMLTQRAEQLGLTKVDTLYKLGSRPQPARTRKCPGCAGGQRPPATGLCDTCAGSTRVPSEQQHAHRNLSALLVFTKAA